MKPGIWQDATGTVFWLHEDGRWQYLSPLFGEWLDCFGRNDADLNLKQYPRNLASFTVPDGKLMETGNVWQSSEGRKYVVGKNGQRLPNGAKLVALTPHGDGDFSYLCGSDYCRCCQ